MEGWFVELCDRFTYSPYANRQILFSLFCRDVYLSDDFLGSAEVTLSDLLPEHSSVNAFDDFPALTEEEEDSAGEGVELCLQLVPKKQQQQSTRGVLRLRIRLIMSKLTSKRCEEAGGVKSFKQQVEVAVAESTDVKGKERKEKFLDEQRQDMARSMAKISLNELLDGDGGKDKAAVKDKGNTGAEKLSAYNSSMRRQSVEQKAYIEEKSEKVAMIRDARVRTLTSTASGKRGVAASRRIANSIDSCNLVALPGMDVKEVTMRTTVMETERRLRNILEHLSEGEIVNNENVEVQLRSLLANLQVFNANGSRMSEPFMRVRSSTAANMAAWRAGRNENGYSTSTVAMDEQDRRWLARTFSVEDSAVMEDSQHDPTCEEGHSNAARKRWPSRGTESPKSIASTSPSIDLYSFNAIRKARRGSNASARSISPVDTATFMKAISCVFSDDAVENEDTAVPNLYYIDSNRDVQGPFKCVDLLSWYKAGFIHEQVPVYMGDHPKSASNPDAPFVPFAIFIDALNLKDVKSCDTKQSWALDDSAFLKNPTDATMQHWSWEFDIFKCTEDQLFLLGSTILESLNIPLVFDVSERSFRAFMDNVR